MLFVDFLDLGFVAVQLFKLENVELWVLLILFLVKLLKLELLELLIVLVDGVLNLDDFSFLGIKHL